VLALLDNPQPRPSFYRKILCVIATTHILQHQQQQQIITSTTITARLPTPRQRSARMDMDRLLPAHTLLPGRR